MGSLPSRAGEGRDLSLRFGNVAVMVAEAAPERTDFPAFVKAWQQFYEDVLYPFELNLVGREQVEEQYRGALLTAHNLQRLVEVLEREVGSSPLHASRVEERLHDLAGEVKRLQSLLAEAAAPDMD
jgi:hypothetical protein